MATGLFEALKMKIDTAKSTARYQRSHLRSSASGCQRKKIIPPDDSAAASFKVSFEQHSKNHSAFDIHEHNVEKALSMFNSEKLFRTVLKEYYYAINKKCKRYSIIKTRKIDAAA